jgi:peptidoglycan/LPS O-acetylase OafA/YrhL
LGAASLSILIEATWSAIVNRTAIAAILMFASVAANAQTPYAGMSPMYVAVIVLGISLLSWAVWRYVERPAQRLTKNVLTNYAVRFGWPSKQGALVAAGPDDGTSLS